MTREEAREAIKEAYGNSEYTDEIIKALEQEPCGKDINVPATDAISRQAVKELFQEACEMEMYDFLGIDDIPSVKPQEPVLDKMRTEIEKQDKWLAQAGYNAYNVDIAFNSIKRVIAESEDKE